MKKLLSIVTILSMSLCFAACDDDNDNSGITKLECNNDVCTCEGNGITCALDHLVTCKDDVATTVICTKGCTYEGDSCIDDEYTVPKPPKNVSTQWRNKNNSFAMECYACSGTGTNCESGSYCTCENSKVVSYGDCKKGCADDSNCAE